MPNFTLGSVDTTNRFRRVTLNGSLLVNDYVRLISPEICVQKEGIESYLKDAAYLDYLCTYASPISSSGAPSGASRITANASKVLQYDGSIASIDSSNNYIKLDNNKILIGL